MTLTDESVRRWKTFKSFYLWTVCYSPYLIAPEAIIQKEEASFSVLACGERTALRRLTIAAARPDSMGIA